MRRIFNFLVPYLFPFLLIIGIFSYFLNSSTYKYFDPEERIIDIDPYNLENIGKNLKKVIKKLRKVDPDNKALRDKLNFVIGYLYYLKHDYTKAEKVLLKSLRKENLLYDYVNYYLAKINVLYNQFKTAIDYLDNIDFNKTTLQAEIIETYGLCNYELGFFDNAATYYETLIDKYSPSKKHTLDYLRILSNIYRNLNNFTQENKVLKEIVLNYPTSSISSHLKARFKKQNYSIYDSQVDLNEFKKTLLKGAKGFFIEKDFASAIKLYKKYLSFFPNDENKILVLNRLKFCYKLSNREEAFSLMLEKIVNLAPSEDSLYALAINYFSNEQYKKSIEIFKKLIVSFPSSFKTYKYLYNLARLNEVTLNYGVAEHYFKKVVAEITSNSSSDEKRYAQKAVFKIGWLYYKQKKYSEAISHFKSALKLKIAFNIKNKINYWTARSYENLGLADKAKIFYNKIIKKDQYSYYALKALENTNGSISKHEIKENASTQFYKTRMVFLPLKKRKALEKIEFFIYYDLINFAKKELSNLGQNYSDQDFLFYLSALKYQVGDILGSIRIINNLTRDSFNDIPKYGLKLLWPKKYWNIVTNYAEKVGVDPYLALSIIRQESAFNPNAVSVANARGLMQILPTVADGVARQLRIYNYNLFEPEDNIKISTTYLSKVLTNHSNKVFALAAYNAGRTPLERWKKRMNTINLEEFIEEIPYDETHHYVKNVLRNYINYRRFYASADNITTKTRVIKQ